MKRWFNNNNWDELYESMIHPYRCLKSIIETRGNINKRGRDNQMLIEKIQLWEDSETVTLHTYILHNSMEFQKDQLRPAVVICPG